MRRKCWGREKNLRQGSLVENKASEWKVQARQTASVVLSGWPKSSFGFSMQCHRKTRMNFLAKHDICPARWVAAMVRKLPVRVHGKGSGGHTWPGRTPLGCPGDLGPRKEATCRSKDVTYIWSLQHVSWD